MWDGAFKMTNEEFIALIEDSIYRATGIYNINKGNSVASITDNLLNNNLIEIGDQEWNF